MTHYFTFMRGYTNPDNEGEDMMGYWVEVECEDTVGDAWDYLEIYYDPAWAVHWTEGEFPKGRFEKGLLKKIV